MAANSLLDRALWRKSSRSTASGNGGNCVEVAALSDGRIAVRNSNDRSAGVVFFNRDEMAAFIAGVKDCEFDDLT